MAMNRVKISKNFAALSTIHTVSKPAAENIEGIKILLWIFTNHIIVLTVKFGESSITVPEQVSEPVVNLAVLNFLPEKSRVFVERCPTSFALNFELNPDKIMTLTYPTRKRSILSYLINHDKMYNEWKKNDEFRFKFVTFCRFFQN